MVIGCVTDRGAAEIRHICQLLRRKYVANKHAPYLVMHYNPTFEYGDYYVNILSYRHPFIDKCTSSNVKSEAIVPLAIFFHQKNANFVHKTALEAVTRRLDEGQSERQNSFSNTKKVVMSNGEFVGSNLLSNTDTLWSHLDLHKNCEEKARELGYTEDESLEIGKNVAELLKPNSNYIQRRKELMTSKLWAGKFFHEFFERNLEEHIVNWLNYPFDLECSIDLSKKGVNNTPSDILNRVLHQEGGDFRPMDMALMKTKYFIDHKDIQINRAYYGIGNYQLNDPDMSKEMKTIPTYQLYTPEEMVNLYQKMTEPDYERQFNESPMKEIWEKIQNDTK